MSDRSANSRPDDDALLQTEPKPKPKKTPTEVKSLTIEKMAEASGLSLEEIKLLGREPYRLLVPHPTSGRFRQAQVSWARFIAELRNDKKLSWLEILAWVEKRQKGRS